MFNKKRSVPLAALILLIGSSAYLFCSRKDETTAKTVLTAKDAVPEIPCYPINQYKTPIKIKKFNYKGKTYFETESLESSHETYVLNFEVTATNCSRIGGSSIASREDFMPKPAAEYFADLNTDEMFQECFRKKKSELNIKKKCNQYIEKLVNVPGTLDGEHTNFLFLENAESLNRRGIKTDKALIVRPKTGYNPMQDEAKSLPTGEALKVSLKKCVEVTPPESVKNISVVQVEVANVPIRGKRTYYDVDVELVNGQSSRHVYQTIFLDPESCRNFYAGSDIGVNTLSEHYRSQADARPQLLTWYKWKLKNVPSERARIQRYLDSPNPKLAEEEYWTFSQLSFKMPKNYRKVP